MEVQIREAHDSDSPEVARVIKAVYDEYHFTWDPDDYHADLYAIDDFYWRKGDQLFIAESDHAVGVIGLCFHPLIPGKAGETIVHDGTIRAAGTDCSLERLYVHPDARRKGVGEALTREVIRRAKETGCKAMELWSDKRFGDAHRLYGRFGAVTIGDRICHDPDQSPEWGLAIAL